jgi:hypothetical protein
VVIQVQCEVGQASRVVICSQTQPQVTEQGAVSESGGQLGPCRVTVRVRVIVPCPHVVEQFPHADHAET